MIAQRDQEPQLFRVEMIDWSGGVMPGLRKGYTEITSSQLSRERMLQ